MALNPPNPTQFTIAAGDYGSTRSQLHARFAPLLPRVPQHGRSHHDIDYGGGHSPELREHARLLRLLHLLVRRGDAAELQRQRGQTYTKDEMDEGAELHAVRALRCVLRMGRRPADDGRVFDFVAGGDWPANPAAGTAP